MWIKTGILFLFLLICAVWDLRHKAIPLWVCLGGLASTAVWQFFTREMDMAGILGGILIGIFLLAAGTITKGQIGSGDGIVFIITGIVLGMRDNFLLLSGSLMISFLFSILLIFLKKINLKTRLPFLPFVFIAYVIELAARLESGYV